MSETVSRLGPALTFHDPLLTLGDLGTSETLLDDDVPSLGSECYADGLGEDVDTLEHGSSTFVAKLDFLVSRIPTDERGGSRGTEDGSGSSEHGGGHDARCGCRRYVWCKRGRKDVKKMGRCGDV